MTDTKQCKKCEEVKSLSEFHKKENGKLGKNSWCKVCATKRASIYSKSHPEKWQAQNKKEENKVYKKFWKLLKRYNLSKEAFEKLLEDQNFTCAICLKVPLEMENGYCVDHDHISGEVRGILCQQCNSGLGMFKDNTDFLFNAILYLKKDKYNGSN